VEVHVDVGVCCAVEDWVGLSGGIGVCWRGLGIGHSGVGLDEDVKGKGVNVGCTSLWLLEAKVLNQRLRISPAARNKRDVNVLSDRTGFRNSDCATLSRRSMMYSVCYGPDRRCTWFQMLRSAICV